MLNLNVKPQIKSVGWRCLVFGAVMSGAWGAMAQNINPPSDVRDPFQPVVTKICQPTPPPSASWRLQGTVGSGEQRSGWIVTPEGHAQRFQTGDLLPSTPWQVALVGTNYVELHLSAQAIVCQHSDVTRFTLSLPKH